MTLVADSIELNSVAEFIDLLNQMIQPIMNPTLSSQTWQDVIDILQEMERGYFASSAGPSGEAWAPLSPVTIKKKGHGIILRETYELEASLIGESSTSIRRQAGNSLEFGTNREWAWVHQSGSEKLNKDGAQFIPQREFLGINDDGMKNVVDAVADAAVMMMFGER